MLPEVLKNVIHRDATRPYPQHPRQPFAGTRGQLENNTADCILCGKCARCCPSQCLSVRRKEGIWEYDPYACILCGRCVDACPTGSLTQKEQYRAPIRKKEKITLRVQVPAARNTGSKHPPGTA